MTELVNCIFEKKLLLLSANYFFAVRENLSVKSEDSILIRIANMIMAKLQCQAIKNKNSRCSINKAKRIWKMIDI